jgi:glycosyltransferase involved in cell wall biosynthesis
MILGIDASNLRNGGGVTHLVELLGAADPQAHGFSKVVVWGGQKTLRLIKDRPWLVKSNQALLEKSLVCRAWWHKLVLSRLARAAECDLLFVPGGSYAGNFRPFVTMSRTLLPFEIRELKRYGLTLITVKLMLIRWMQTCTFRRADGVIFLTKYARDVVRRIVRGIFGRTKIIPHGIGEQFRNVGRHQVALKRFSLNKPIRVLYVSHIVSYKHQWNVVEAVGILRRTGLPVVLDLVGPEAGAIVRLEDAIHRVDPRGEFVRYRGAVPYAEIHKWYSEADLSVFASSCENMPNILLESMASGLPIACSNRGPMREVLGDAGVYFDPEAPTEIAEAIRILIEDANLRAQKAEAAFERAKLFSWRRCAEDTLSFLSAIARET